MGLKTLDRGGLPNKHFNILTVSLARFPAGTLVGPGRGRTVIQWPGQVFLGPGTVRSTRQSGSLRVLAMAARRCLVRRCRDQNRWTTSQKNGDDELGGTCRKAIETAKKRSAHGAAQFGVPPWLRRPGFGSPAGG